MASITVTLRGEGDASGGNELGFLVGLRNGWHAFVAALGWVLTGIGTVLPFLVALLLVGLPARLLLRKWRPTSSTAEQSES